MGSPPTKFIVSIVELLRMGEPFEFLGIGVSNRGNHIARQYNVSGGIIGKLALK